MKKIVIFFLALVLLTPSFAFPGMFTFKAGFFVPQANFDVRDDNLWWFEFDNMDLSKTDYQTTNFGFAYEYFVTRQISLVLGVDTYNKNKYGSYEGYVGETIGALDYAFDYGEGFPISHSFNVSITPIQLSLKFVPTGRRGKFIPYIGGGVGLYLWNVTLRGNLIMDEYEWFYDPDLDQDVRGYIVELADLIEDYRLSLGYHAFGGIMMPVANRISLEVEFKYNYAQGELKEAFLGFEPFDLSGYQISLGLNYWF